MSTNSSVITLLCTIVSIPQIWKENGSRPTQVSVSIISVACGMNSPWKTQINKKRLIFTSILTGPCSIVPGCPLKKATMLKLTMQSVIKMACYTIEVDGSRNGFQQ